MSKKYIVDGINKLDDQLKASGRPYSQDVLESIQRQVIASMIARREEINQAIQKKIEADKAVYDEKRMEELRMQEEKEAMERDFEERATQYGSGALLYRAVSKEMREVVVGKAIDRIQIDSVSIKTIAANEFEMNYQRLRAANPQAASLFDRIGQNIDLVRSTFEENNERDALRRFDDFVDNSEEAQHAELMSQARKSAQELSEDLSPEMKEKMGFSIGVRDMKAPSLNF